MLIRVLVQLHPPELAQRIEAIVGKADVVLLPGQGDDLWKRLGDEAADLVILNRAAVAEPLEQVIPAVRRTPERPEVVVLADQEAPEERAKLQSVGSFAVVYRDLPTPILSSSLVALVRRRREQRVAWLGNDKPAYRLGDFVSRSPTMQQLLTIARRVATSDSSVLLLGETGVGKEWLARALHEEGARRTGPFVAINCSALPESLLESELFGYEKGAFTGAVRAKRGLFELAHGGTLFLDEIGDMSAHLQVKLLRVLQERRVQRLGADHDIPVDMRIMAATNRDLEVAMASREFRTDLYYRLSVVTLTVPPLRERREDIPALVENYLARFRAQLGRHGLEVDQNAIDALTVYDWPGNVRELINVVERAVLLANHESIGIHDLSAGIASGGQESGGLPVSSGASPTVEPLWDKPLLVAAAQAAADFERRYLERLLAATGGRVGETAERAGIDTRTLYNKMRALGLRKEDFRAPKRRG